MRTTEAYVERVVLPLYSRGEESQLIMAASVLASWLKVPLQFVAPDKEAAAACDVLAGTLGIPTEPAACIESASFIEGTVEHLRRVGPAVCVASGGRGGLDIARRSGQATLLVGGSSRARVATGPIVVGLTGQANDLDVVATVAVWALGLDCGVRIVTEAGTAQPHVAEAAQRLRDMGIEVGIDALRSGGISPLVLLGRTREATAIAVSLSRGDAADVIAEAEEQQVPVLLVPQGGGAGSNRPAAASPEEATDGDDNKTAGHGNLEYLTFDQCLEALEGQSIARVAYVDDGWPTVVPVNYAVHGDVVFIRSREGGKLDAARRNDVVCFEVDETDAETRTGWSVVGHGALTVVNDPDTLQNAWQHDPSPWIDGDDWHWLQLVPFSLTGRRVQPRSTDRPTEE